MALGCTRRRLLLLLLLLLVLLLLLLVVLVVQLYSTDHASDIKPRHARSAGAGRRGVPFNILQLALVRCTSSSPSPLSAAWS
jgi:hypothetical protein